MTNRQLRDEYNKLVRIAIRLKMPMGTFKVKTTNFEDRASSCNRLGDITYAIMVHVQTAGATL